MKISPWIVREDCSFRTIEGADPEDISKRVAFIEKTPRVRIREHYLGVKTTHWDNAGHKVSEDRQWPEWLDWCSGNSGKGPTDINSMDWCDRMLEALGYQHV